MGLDRGVVVQFHVDLAHIPVERRALHICPETGRPADPRHAAPRCPRPPTCRRPSARSSAHASSLPSPVLPYPCPTTSAPTPQSPGRRENAPPPFSEAPPRARRWSGLPRALGEQPHGEADSAGNAGSRRANGGDAPPSMNRLWAEQQVEQRGQHHVGQRDVQRKNGQSEVVSCDITAVRRARRAAWRAGRHGGRPFGVRADYFGCGSNAREATRSWNGESDRGGERVGASRAECGEQSAERGDRTASDV